MGVEYIKTLTGLAKAVQELFNFIALICVAATGVSPRGDAFLAASVGAFLITGIILALFLLGFNERIPIPWIKVEFFYNVIWAVFYLITSALVIDVKIDGYIAGGCFGLFATVMMCLDAYEKFSHQMAT